jgi:hypothetical protein
VEYPPWYQAIEGPMWCINKVLFSARINTSHPPIFMMARLLALVCLFFCSLSNVVLASPCIAFDANFNLLAFGFGNKDWNAGTQDTWSSSQ